MNWWSYFGVFLEGSSCFGSILAAPDCWNSHILASTLKCAFYEIPETLKPPLETIRAYWGLSGPFGCVGGYVELLTVTDVAFRPVCSPPGNRTSALKKPVAALQDPEAGHHRKKPACEALGYHVNRIVCRMHRVDPKYKPKALKRLTPSDGNFRI